MQKIVTKKKMLEKEKMQELQQCGRKIQVEHEDWQRRIDDIEQKMTKIRMCKSRSFLGNFETYANLLDEKHELPRKILSLGKVLHPGLSAVKEGIPEKHKKIYQEPKCSNLLFGPTWRET